MSVDWRRKYHTLLNETIKKLEDTYLVSQREAEMNVEASKCYIKELQSQLQISQKQVKELKDKLETKTSSPSLVSIDTSSGSDNEGGKHRMRAASGSTSSLQNKLRFLESLTCLNVIPSSDNTYHCTLDDGKLNGHEFNLILDSSRWEYTYVPTNPAKCLQEKDELLETFFFPDYMLPRFLIKLLNATYDEDDKDGKVTSIN